jgi:transcriptional regulator with XRE-family HTH domain
MPKITGPQLRRARLRAGITQTRLADAVGVSHQAVCQLEQRASVPPERAATYLRALMKLVRASVEEPAGE